jgi:hypothetical protein
MIMAVKDKDKLQKRYENQNKYINEKYDRVSVVLPKGAKERIKATGDTVNNFIANAVMNRLLEIEEDGAPVETPAPVKEEKPMPEPKETAAVEPISEEQKAKDAAFEKKRKEWLKSIYGDDFHDIMDEEEETISPQTLRERAEIQKEIDDSKNALY